MGTYIVLQIATLNFVPIFAPLFHEFQVVTSKFMIFQQLPEKCYTCNYRNVANRSMSRLVAPPRIFRLLMKGKFDTLCNSCPSLLFTTLHYVSKY